MRRGAAFDRQRRDRVRTGRREGVSVRRLTEDPRKRHVGQNSHSVGRPGSVGVGGAETQLGHLAAVIVREPVAAEGDGRGSRRSDAVEIEQASVELERARDRVGGVGELQVALPVDGQSRRGDLAAHAGDQGIATHVDDTLRRRGTVAEVKGGAVEVDAAGGVRVDRDKAAAM